MIGYAMCGSFCTLGRSLKVMRELKDMGYDILPIMSENVWSTDTRFGTCEYFREKVVEICDRPIIHTIVDAEPIGPKGNLELLVIAPCTGNTLAKLASGITDTSVTMAAKAQLRADKPVLIALASNDALSANLKNIAVMRQKKHVFFAHSVMDDPVSKPHSLVAEFSDIRELVPKIIAKYK